MRYPVRYPDGRIFGPYSLEELKQYSSDKVFPPNTEIEAAGEWVSLGGWLVVRQTVERIVAEEASRPRAAPPPPSEPPPPPAQTANSPNVAIAIGAVAFLVVVGLALALR